MLKTFWFAITSICLVGSAAHAQEFHLEAVCSVNQADASGGTAKTLIANKKLNLEIGSGSAGSQTIGVFEGFEFRMSSPFSISVPYILIEVNGAQQKVQAGRDVGSANSNLIVLAVETAQAGTISAICTLSIQ